MHQQEFRSRPLQVKISSSQGAKRTATSIVSQVGKSQSPGVNGAESEVEMPAGERAARTLGLMNIPDTVNDTRVRTRAEQYGKLIKVILRPDHQGAIVEYANVGDAGKASLELEGQEIEKGRRIHVGTVAEMLKQRAEKRGARKDALFPSTGPIRRPQQPARGRRGGLGVRRAPIGTRRESVEDGGGQEGQGGQGGKMSNDDFRTMMHGNNG